MDTTMKMKRKYENKIPNESAESTSEKTTHSNKKIIQVIYDRAIKWFIRRGFDKKAENIIFSGKVQDYIAGISKKLDSYKERLKPLWSEIDSIITCLLSKDFPAKFKILALASIIYLITPIDLIPDVLGIGLIDDICVLVQVISTIFGSIKNMQGKENMNEDQN